MEPSNSSPGSTSTGSREPSNVLRIDNITKSFGDRRALDDVTFDVKPGRLTGFVGSNGAGKTTAMRIILGVLAADSGTVSLGGEVVAARDRARFGYMPEERGLYPKMRVAEQLVYLARLHGLTRADARANTEELLHQLHLTERADDAVETLSLGNQQRAQIAAALVHAPHVLVLDEPFSGLDPIAVDTVVAVLKSRAALGVPVLFSSHQLDIVERLCDDIVVIADGSIRAAGSRESLRDERAGLRFELVVAGDSDWVRGVPGVRVIQSNGGTALFEVDDPSVAQSVLGRAIALGSITSFRRDRPSLAQIFREVIR